jgi:hypothetical protein
MSMPQEKFCKYNKFLAEAFQEVSEISSSEANLDDGNTDISVAFDGSWHHGNVEVAIRKCSTNKSSGRQPTNSTLSQRLR